MIRVCNPSRVDRRGAQATQGQDLQRSEVLPPAQPITDAILEARFNFKLPFLREVKTDSWYAATGVSREERGFDARPVGPLFQLALKSVLAPRVIFDWLAVFIGQCP
jgi:hypothetical protein